MANASVMKVVGTPIESLTKESAIRSLNTLSKSQLIIALNAIASQGPGATDGLKVGNEVMRLLGHPDPDVVVAACKALGETCYGRATSLLVAALAHPSAVVRVAALDAIACMGASNDSSLNASVVALIKDADTLVKIAALKALGDMEALATVESVKSCLQDSVPEVKAAAFESLSIFIGISQEVESTFSEEDRASTISSLCNNSRTKQAALSAVCSMGEKAPSSCVAKVVSCLGDKDMTIRTLAVAAVGVMPAVVMADKESLGLIKGFLSSGDSGTKAAALSALATIGAPAKEFADSVIDLLADDTEDTSSLALQVGSGAKRPVPSMRRPKCAALVVLGRFCDEKHIEKISEALNDQIWEVRLCAAEALGMFGSAAKSEVGTLSSLCGDDDTFPVRATACTAIGRIGDTEGLSKLVDSFTDSSHSVRLAAVEAVSMFGEGAEEYSHEIFKLVNDSVGHVRGQAVKTLAALGAIGQNYASVVATLILDEDPEVRASVCEALSMMGEAGAALAEEVSERMTDASPEVRTAAAYALESFGFNVAPMLRDNPATKSWKVEGIPGGRVEAGRPESFEGLGLYYADIQSQKSSLMSSGKWIEGIV